MNNKWTRTNLSTNDAWTFLICTIRYSMGRMTAMPSECIDLYQRYGHLLSNQQKKQIANEIRNELDRCEEVGKFLGMQCDHNTWKQLDSIIINSLEPL